MYCCIFVNFFIIIIIKIKISLINMITISRIADTIAIPFFLILTIYFYKKNNLTYIELILYIFSICGFIIDILFSLGILI